MNYLYNRRFLLYIFYTLFVIGTCSAQYSYKTNPKNVEKGLFGKTGCRSKKAKLKEPRSVLKAKRQQEKKEKILKKEYAQSVERSRKRSYEIQSPEVQARMKQNQKDTTIRGKEKKKNVKAASKKAGKKYK
jgi:hypothetical protein